MKKRVYLRAVLEIIFLCDSFASAKIHDHTAHTLPSTQTDPTPNTEDRAIALRRNLLDCTEETRVNPDIILKLRSGQWKYKIVYTTNYGWKRKLWLIRLGRYQQRYNDQQITAEPDILKREPSELKNWALCLLVKSNMMSSEGVLKQDVVLAPIPEYDRNLVEKVIDKCLFKKPHSPPETAWHYLKCFHYRFPKYSII